LVLIGFKSINFTEGKYADLLWVNIWELQVVFLYCVPKWIKKKMRQLTGKVLVFGVYSNFNTQAIAQVAQKKVLINNCISTGDIIGYCAQPEETIQFFKIGSTQYCWYMLKFS
jgi:hypothetical protein